MNKFDDIKNESKEFRDEMKELEKEIQELHAEFDELHAQFKLLQEERGIKDDKLKAALSGLDYTDEMIRLDDDMYVVRRAIGELEWKLHVQNGGH